jgi:DNA-binding transcriptional LysR family regulator
VRFGEPSNRDCLRKQNRARRNAPQRCDVSAETSGGTGSAAAAGVKVRTGPIVDLLDMQIALVEAQEGIAIIPSFGMPACRNRMITTSQLINPVVRFDFHMISRRGIELPPGAEEFTSFLKSYIATWAGRAGVL